MPSLPANLVKPPVFESALRRTTPPAPQELDGNQPSGEVAEPGGVEPSIDENPGEVISIATKPKAKPKASRRRVERQPDIVSPQEATGISSDGLHRITVGVDDQTRRALEAECFQRRMAREKTNVTEIVRNILAQWASSRVGSPASARPSSSASAAPAELADVDQDEALERGAHRAG